MESRWQIYVFLQAEDGIRDIGVTGVQTCALPIFQLTPQLLELPLHLAHPLGEADDHLDPREVDAQILNEPLDLLGALEVPRSEERRVGKECRSRWSPYH